MARRNKRVRNGGVILDEIEQQIEQQAQQMLQPKDEKDNSVNTIIEQKIKLERE